ncbi:uncharacterized protein G2W53_037443 [Senna tora]|uniref:Uncharacterized protein n=1 Tax=Senna tora TaxID=362788 RepID=A0A834SUW4_9FABA|nr:uncharacterized protein G2W53_037443 [Senna tora]
MVLGWKRDWNMGERLGSVFGEGMKGWLKKATRVGERRGGGSVLELGKKFGVGYGIGIVGDEERGSRFGEGMNEDG